MRDMLVCKSETPEEMYTLESKVFISLVDSKDNVTGIRSVTKKQHPYFSGTFNRKAVPFWPWWGADENELSSLKL